MHNDAANYIKQCYDLARGCGLPSDAYTLEAFRYLLRRKQPSGATGVALTTPADTATPDILPATPIQQLADKLGMDIAEIEMFYTISGGTVILHLPQRALPAKVSAAMREIAILVTVANKLAGLAEETPYSQVRSVCDTYNKLDPKNFTAILASLSPRLITTGRGHNRSLIAKEPATGMARSILEKYKATI